mgnify:CR=1 FL=1
MKRCNHCGAEIADNARFCSDCGREMSGNSIKKQPDKKSNKNALFGMVFGVIAFFGVYFIMQQFVFKAPTFDENMMKVASDINKSCPIMIDNVTRLDNAITVPPKVIQYNFTLIEMEKATVDVLEIKKQLEPNIINFARTNPDMKYFRDNDVTIKYNYKDKNSVYLFDISVSPEQYKK